MFSMFYRLRYYLTDYRVLAVVGVVSAAALMFFGSDGLATIGIWVIALIVLIAAIWAVVWMVRRVRGRRAAKKLDEMVEGDADRAVESAKPAARADAEAMVSSLEAASLVVVFCVASVTSASGWGSAAPPGPSVSAADSSAEACSASAWRWLATSCGSVPPHGHRELEHPEVGYYAIGAKSYGRAPNFLLATGYEQARSVVAALAGDMRAADDVQLVLPETGVCVTDLAEDKGGGGCCATPAAQKPASLGCCPPPAAQQSAVSGCCPAPDKPKTASGCCG